MSSNFEQEAEKYVLEAERRLSQRSFLRFIFGSKIDAAINCYTTAGILYKKAEKWVESGGAFRRSAKLNVDIGQREKAAILYANAANSFKQCSPEVAEDCYLRSAMIYTDLDRFIMAANLHKAIAEMYENFDVVPREKVIEHYYIAAVDYSTDDSRAMADNCWAKLAAHRALLGEHHIAAGIYEQNGFSCNESKSSARRDMAKEYLFRAGLCYLCVNKINTQDIIDSYEGNFPGFQDSREGKFLSTIVSCVREKNSGAFEEAMEQYDNSSRLEPWHRCVLQVIKEKIDSDVNLSRRVVIFDN